MTKRNNTIAYRWELIALLWFAFFLNQGDRQIYNVVMPLIKVDLGLSDVQLGLVATIFTAIYGVLVPFAGFVSDKIKKSRVVFLSLLIFSMGTLLTGISGGLIMLIIFRSVATGAGEAFYYPAANSLIGEFHKKTRAQAMAVHQTANYIGIVASGFLAGYLGEQYGWRSAFYSFGLLGIVLAAIVYFRLKDAPKKQSASDEQLPFREAAAHILKKKSLYIFSLAFGGMVFVHIGYLTWTPTFLHENFGLSLSNAGFSSVFYHHALAFIGVIIGGKVSDRLAQKRKQIRVETKIFGLLLGAPFIYIMGVSNQLMVVYLALAMFGFFRGIYDSNLFAALFDVIEPKYRASATGIMLSAAFLIGALAPITLGWIKQGIGINYGLASLSIVYVMGALLLMIGLKRYFFKDFVEEAQ
ncbi:MAG: MFS transporter [Bacteroidota bacterium]